MRLSIELSDIKKHLTLENIALIVAMILALGWAWSTIHVLTKNYDLEKQVQQAQVMELQNENLRLQQAYYQTDEFLELQARTLLNKAKPGEHLVILPQSSAKDSDTSTNTTSVVTEKSNFEQWMDFLFGRQS